MKKQLLTFLLLGVTTLTTFAQVPSYVPTNGLVGYWPFNGNANDESGNGIILTNNGLTLTMNRFGESNKAFHFASSNNLYLNRPVSNGLEFSYSFWMKKINSDNNSHGICETNDISTSGGGFDLYNNIPQFICQGIATNVTNSNYTIEINK
jgi:hypothetical protein